jgi:photosystem II stability/assembly factor-like uncharacterized protein
MKKLLFNSLLSAAAFLFVVNTQAQTWESIETPVSTNLILQDISFPAGQDLIGFTGGTNVTYNGKGKILKTEDGGESWEVIWESEVNGTGVTSIYFHSTLTGFAGTMAGNLMKTTDGGTTWTSTDIDGAQDQGELTDLEFFDTNNGALISQWNGIYVTSDGGDTWTVASTNYFGGQDLAYADASTLFAVGGEQMIYKSTDGGATWTFSYQGPNGPNPDLWYNLGVHFYDADNGIVTSEEGQTFMTSDGGDSWTLSTIPQYGLMNGAWMVDLDHIYVCATPGEVFYTEDGGANWTSETYNFEPSYYKIKFTDNGTGFVCGSGSNGGTILRKLPAVVDGISEVEWTHLSLYPNPAKDVINLSFEGNTNEVYMVKIISPSGKMVYSQEYQSIAGKNRIKIELNELAEGNYLISIDKENEHILTNKFQIIR